MKLWIEWVRPDEFNPADPNAEFYNCDLCGGVFIPEGALYCVKTDLESEDEEDEVDALRFICSACASLKPETFKRALDRMASQRYYEAYEAETDANEIERLLGLGVDLAAFKVAPTTRIIARRAEADTLRKVADELWGFARAFEIETLGHPVKVPVRPTINGYIYLLGSPDGYCKIGRTKQLSSRLLAIGLQLPFRVELLHSIKVSDPIWAERFLHQKFSACRMNGEWFLLSDADISWIKSLNTLEPGDAI